MKKYRNLETGQIGELIKDDCTVTLRFEDMTTLILSPYYLRNEWMLIRDEISFGELVSRMMDWNEAHDQEKPLLSGVIVISADSFKKDYSEESRSYRVWNNNRMFQVGKISSSLFGNCLDGTDDGVRLDWYIHDKKWRVDFCYIES